MHGRRAPRDAGRQAVPCVASPSQPKLLEVPGGVRGSGCSSRTTALPEGKDPSAAEAIQQRANGFQSQEQCWETADISALAGAFNGF